VDLKLLKNRNYSLLLFGESSSIFGDILLNIGLALYVLKLTGSAGKFALILSVGLLPRVLLGLFAGAIVDRFDKKKIMILLDVARGIYLSILFMLWLLGYMNLFLVYVTVVFFSVCSIFFNPCAITVLPSILKEEELVSGNSIMNVCIETISILAGIIAAGIYGIAGIGVIILLDAVTFLISAASEMLIDFKSSVSKNKKATVLEDVIEGMKVFTSDSRIVSLVINGTLTHLFLFPFIMIGIPYLLVTVLKCPDVYYGIVEATAAAGMVIAPFIVTMTKNKVNTAKGINVGIIGMMVAVVAFLPLINPDFVQMLMENKVYALLYFSIANLFMYLAFGYYVVFFVSFYQKNIPNEYLGRFGSTLSLLFSIGRIIGFSLFGFLLAWSISFMQF